VRVLTTQIQSTCDVPRPLAYYVSRSHCSTVIRQISTQEAVCWIILHADGALGALYTLPDWRRKGLAEIVVRQNIRWRNLHLDGKGGRRDFCYVFKGNTASERLWVKMGWEEGWGVRWIVNRKVEEARGKVARFSHPDEEG
jgi:GNAT superfamily N-acetyltransferase